MNDSTRLSALFRRTLPWLSRLSLTLAVALLPALAGAQGLSGSSSSNAGSTCSGANNSDGFCGSSTQVLVNNTTTFQSRHAWNINADVGALTTRNTSGNAQHNMSFNATAPGSYQLNISTSRVGMMQRNDDLLNCNGSADTSGITGSTNIALASGSLSTGDPGAVGNGGGNNQQGFNQPGSAVIGPRLSNGAPQGHNLTFTWNGSVRSNSCEAAVRQGQQNGTTTSCGACEYPGSPSRTQANDGHFVTVTFTNFCGNGVIDGTGEQCDAGGANGAATSCCNTNCTFRTAGAVCRASAGVCDVQETCPANPGTAGACPANGFLSSANVCRASAGVCDVAENCPGNAAACPADGFLPSSTVCRGSSGVCDPAENCPGNAAACPGDAVAPTSQVCRAAAGVCDIAENCDGVNDDCPGDAIEPASTVCRPSAGVCDIDENCDGVGVDCPTDVFESSAVVCRAQGGVCDVAENCTGSSAPCPTDVTEPSSTVCRASSDVCDTTENCTGTPGVAGYDCPADAVEPTTTLCRPLSPTCATCTGGFEDCDLEEYCDGATKPCPPDLVKPDIDADTVCDELDNCGVIPNPAQEDGDLDGEGDACDDCTDLAQTFIATPRLMIGNLTKPAGARKTSFGGSCVQPLTPPIDLDTTGLRFIVKDSNEVALIDALIPPGQYDPLTRKGWRQNPRGWFYSSTDFSENFGIYKVTVNVRPDQPHALRFKLKGRDGAYFVAPNQLPLRVSMVMQPPSGAISGQCCASTYKTNECRFDNTLKTLTCRPPARP